MLRVALKRSLLAGYVASVGYGYLGLVGGGADPALSLPLACVVGPLEIAGQLRRLLSTKSK